MIEKETISVELLNIVLRLYIKYIRGSLIKNSQEQSYNQDGKYRERQDMLIDINIIEIISSALSKEANVEILENLLNLAIELLEGGNSLG